MPQRPLNKFNLTASNVQLKCGMQHCCRKRDEAEERVSEREESALFIFLSVLHLKLRTLEKQFSAMTINYELRDREREGTQELGVLW